MMPAIAAADSRPLTAEQSDGGGAGTLIEHHIDGQEIGRLQILVVAIVLLILMLDGMDVQMLALVAPGILSDWGIVKATLGPVIATSMIGVAAGTFLGGRLGDRFGRKTTILSGLTIAGLATIGCAACRDVPQLMLLRFLCGLGGGACFPGATALAGEWLPKRRKSLAVGFVSIGVPVGVMLGSLLVFVALPRWGWRGTFVVAGVLPLAAAGIGVLLLPESLSWLATKRAADARIAQALRRAWPGRPVPPAPYRAAERSKALGGGKVLTRANRRINAGIWLGFFANMIGTGCYLTWSTVMLTGAGYGLGVALSTIFFMNLAGILAIVTCSYLATRIGTKRLVVSSGATAAAISLIPASAGLHPDSLLVPLCVVAAGGCLGAGQALLYVITSHAYPVEIRASGIGFGAAMGRLASITAALGGGLVLTYLPAGALFAMIALTSLLASAAALVIDRHVPPRRAAAVS